MTQEQIIALDSKKHIKIWLLHRQDLSRRQIADLLGTNPGHVGNEIKAYAVNKEKRDAAEVLLQGPPPVKKVEESDYQKASKIPKGGTVNATQDNLLAWSAETVAKKHAMQPEAIYNWAKKHRVDLTKYGHILSKVESNSALLADVLNDKYEETKGLIESGATENKSFGDRMKEAREKKAQEKATMSPEELEKESFNKLLAKVDSLSGKEILKHFGLRDDQNMYGTAKRGTIFDKQYTYLSEDKYTIAGLKAIYVFDKKMPLTIKLVSQKMVSREDEHRYESGEDTESEYGVSKTSNFDIDVFYKKTDFKIGTLKNTGFSSEINPLQDAYRLLKEYFRNKTLIATPIDFKTAEEVINNTINYKTESTAWRKNKVSEDDKKKAKADLDRWYDESWKSIKERLKERGFKSSHQLFDENKAVLDNTYRAGILLSRTPLYKAFEIRIDYEMQRHPYNTVGGQIMASKSDIIAKYSEEAREQREKYRHGYDSMHFAAQKLAEDLNSVLDTNYTGNGYFYSGSMVGFGIYKGTKKFGNGGILEGPKHGSGGIKATLPDGNPIELEGGEIIINAKAAKENCQALSEINQSAGNGVAFPCNNPALDGVQGPMNGNGAKIKTSISEELINSLTSDAQSWEDVKPVSNEIAKANITFLKSLPEFEYGDSSSPKYNPVDYKDPFIWLMFGKVYLIIPSGLKYNKYVGDMTAFWKNMAGDGAKIEDGLLDKWRAYLKKYEYTLENQDEWFDAAFDIAYDYNSNKIKNEDTRTEKSREQAYILLEKVGKPYAGEGAKIEDEHEDLYNELASLIPGGMPLSKEAFFEKIAKTHIKEDPDYYKKLEEYVEPKAGNGYEVVWTDRDYKSHSKKFFNDPQGAPENDLLAAKRYAKMLNEKDANSPYGLYRSVDVKRMVSNDASKKPYYLLTKEEAIAERDRLEALGNKMTAKDQDRMASLCRYSYTKFKTLLKDLK